MSEALLNSADANALLAYNPATGEFVWKRRSGADRATKIFNSKHAGRVAGGRCPRGYVYVHIRGKGNYLGHRLAWLLVKGEWPPAEIDHANGNPSDNAWANIRPASRAENAVNRGVQRNSKSGVKGVYWRPDKRKWAAQIAFNREVLKIGYFDTVEAAQAAYESKAQVLHGAYARR